MIWLAALSMTVQTAPLSRFIICPGHPRCSQTVVDARDRRAHRGFSLFRVDAVTARRPRPQNVDPIAANPPPLCLQTAPTGPSAADELLATLSGGVRTASITFVHDDAALEGESDAVLTRLFARPQEATEVSIRIFMGSEEDPNSEAMLTRRAETVVRFLTGLGVSESRIEIVGWRSAYQSQGCPVFPKGLALLEVVGG